MFNQIDLTPAYGRDYKGTNELLIDWHKGLDFKSDYGYVNIDAADDLKAKGIMEANFRFCKLSKKLVVKL